MDAKCGKKWTSSHFKIINDIFGKWANIKNAKPEDTICLDICNNIRGLIFDGKFRGIFFHVENETGGKRSAQYNLLKKVTGKIPGVADYVFINCNEAVLIEIKTPNGKMSKAQKTFNSWCEMNAVPYYICKSWEEVKEVLEKYDFIRK